MRSDRSHLEQSNFRLRRVNSNRASRGYGSLVNASLLSTGLTDAPAPVLKLAAPANIYPPKLDIVLSESLAVGDTLRLQAASDAAFIYKLFDRTLVVGANDAVNRAAMLPGLSAISRPALTFFRARFERGSSTTAWSNVLKHGESNSPSITSNPVLIYSELMPLAHALTASEAVTWSIAGGRDASLLEIQGSTLRLSGNLPLDHEVQSTYQVTVRATDLAENSSDQDITITVSNVGEQANSFSFAPMKNAAISTVYVSNPVSVAGLAHRVSVPVTVTNGAFSKNGGPFSSAVGTATNGDSFVLRVQSSADYASARSVSLTLGGGAEAVSGKYTVTTLPDPQGAAWQAEPLPPIKYVNYQTNFAEFEAINFSEGLGVILVSSTGRRIDTCSVDGIHATLVSESGAQNGHASIWTIPVTSAGPKQVRVGNSSLFLGPIAISAGTIKRSRAVAVQSASREYGYSASPTSLGTRLEVPPHGLGLVVAVSESGITAPAWAEAEDDGNIKGGAGSTINHAVARLVRSGTPELSGWGWAGTGMAAAVWGPQ
jgi:hypothetical protein